MHDRAVETTESNDARLAGALVAWAVEQVRKSAVPKQGLQTSRLSDLSIGRACWGEVGLCMLARDELDTGSWLLAQAEAAEADAAAAFELAAVEWEDQERQRLRAAAECARALAAEEEARTAQAKVQVAIAAVAAANSAINAIGGGVPGAAADWEERQRRRKGKMGRYGDEEEPEAGVLSAPVAPKRARQPGAAPNIGGRQPGGGYGGQQAPGAQSVLLKRRKGEEEGARRSGAGASGGARKPRLPLGLHGAVAAPLPWSPAEDALLGAIVKEFCRPRTNWPLAADVLAQGAPFRGVYRRPEQCRSHWEQTVKATGEADEAVRDDDVARGRRRHTLASLLPLEQELLKLQLERLCLVAVKQRQRRATELEAAHSIAHEEHPSWKALTLRTHVEVSNYVA